MGMYEAEADVASPSEVADLIESLRKQQAENRVWRKKGEEQIAGIRRVYNKLLAEAMEREAIYKAQIPVNFTWGILRRTAYFLGFRMCRWANRGCNAYGAS